MDALLRCRYMSNKFLNLAYRAANFPQCTMLVDSTLDILCKQIEEMIITCPSTSVSPSVFSTNDTPPNDVLSNARLKKKEVQTKTSKRRKNWLDKKRKFRKKRENKATSQFGEEANNDAAHAHVPYILVEGGQETCRGEAPAQAQAQAQALVGDGIDSKDNMGGLSFTQMLMGPIKEDLFY